MDNNNSNNNDNRVNDPTAPGYGQTDKADNPINKEAAACTEQLANMLPNTSELTQTPGFDKGKVVDWHGLQVQAHPAGSAFYGNPMSRQVEYRKLGTGVGVFNKDSPDDLNFAQISAGDQNLTMTSSFQAGGEQLSSTMAIELKLAQMANKKDRIHKTFTIESHGATRDPTRQLRYDPFRVDKHQYLMNRRNAKKPRKDLDRSPLTGKCTNCDQFGHTVIDCWGPTDEYGTINRCPCNGPYHRADHCDRVKEWPNVLKYKIFYLRRIGLPPFKYYESWVHLIVHDPEIAQLHNIVKKVLRSGCPIGDRSLSWRYNPLTMHFTRQTWNHAQPWKSHDYSKPQERWCNMPDPAYKAENWLEQAKHEKPLNPLGQSFINRQMARNLPGMEPTWNILHDARALGETTNFDAFKQNMQDWLAFYNSVDDVSSQYMEHVYQTMSTMPDTDLARMLKSEPESVANTFSDNFNSKKASYLPAKPGIGVPRALQNKPDQWPQCMLEAVCFVHPNVAPATGGDSAASQSAGVRDRRNQTRMNRAEESGSAFKFNGYRPSY